jgi:hypothetical protein
MRFQVPNDGSCSCEKEDEAVVLPSNQSLFKKKEKTSLKDDNEKKIMLSYKRLMMM